MNKDQLQQAFEQAKSAGDFENAYVIEQQLKSAPVEFDAMEAIKNIPGSAANVAGEVYSAVRHPIDTSKAMGSLVQSGMNKVGRKAAEYWSGQKMEPDMPGRSEAPINAAADFYKGRYGSLGAVKQTAMDDPVGMLLDASVAGSASKIPGLAKVARAIDPINAGAKVGQTALKVIPKNFAAKLYDSAAKFSNRAGFDRNAAVRVALDEGFVPTQSGVKRVQGRIDTLNTLLDDLIAESSASGTKIPVNAVEAYIDELRKTKGGFRLGRGKDVQQIDKILGQWHKDLAELGGGAKITHVTPEFMQSFKKDVWKDVNWNAGRMKGTQVKEDVYKAMGRAAKDEIVKAIPEASEINKTLGQLLEMQPELIKAAGRIDKHNLFGLDTSVKVGAGAATGSAAGAPAFGAALGMAVSLLGNPRVKPRIAIALKRLRDGDVAWIDRNIGDPAVRASLVLAGRAEEILSAPIAGSE